MAMLPVSSYYLVQMICSPISCDFSTVHTHKLPSSTCYSFHYPPPYPITPPAQCLLPTHPLMTSVQLVVQIFLVFPECPGLAALLSLASIAAKQRQSVFTMQHPIATFTCTANTSECEVVICEPVASTV